MASFARLNVRPCFAHDFLRMLKRSGRVFPPLGPAGSCDSAAAVLVYFSPCSVMEIKARLPFVIYIVLFALNLLRNAGFSSKAFFGLSLSCWGHIWDQVTDAFRRERCGELNLEEDGGGFDSKTRRWRPLLAPFRPCRTTGNVAF